MNGNAPEKPYTVTYVYVIVTFTIANHKKTRSFPFIQNLQMHDDSSVKDVYDVTNISLVSSKLRKMNIKFNANN